MDSHIQKPSEAFLTLSWVTLFLGIIAYVVGLWNSVMLLNEKGFYFILLAYGLFAAISLQKTVRDKLEGIHVTSIYLTACSLSLALSVLLLSVGLWNASLMLSEKGFYAMSFILALFAAVTVQKNVRDLALYDDAVMENKNHLSHHQED